VKWLSALLEVQRSSFYAWRAAAAGPDRTEKRLLYAELELAWDAARPALPLYQQLQVDVAPRALAGVDPASAGVPLTWNAREWRFATR